MHALIDAGDTLSAAYGLDDAIARDRGSVRQTQHAVRSQVPSGLERGRQSLRHRQPT